VRLLSQHLKLGKSSSLIRGDMAEAQIIKPEMISLVMIIEVIQIQDTDLHDIPEEMMIMAAAADITKAGEIQVITEGLIEDRFRLTL
jgi:hypothetical protein